MKIKYKISMIFKMLLVLLIHMAVSTLMHVLGSILEGSHGSPSFLTPGFIIYGIISSFLLIGAYILLGQLIPVKNRVLKGIFFVFLFWVSDYISQIVGILGAESSVLNADALSFTTVIFDSVGYFIAGIFMGLLLDFNKCSGYQTCSNRNLLAACVISMVTFPAIIFILEMAVGYYRNDLLSYAVFGISEQEKISYYIIFYLCQTFSGFIFPIFFRLTEYNSKHKRKWLWFASVYGWMLWAPIVMIVTFFGVPVLPTILFTFILVLAIYIDCIIFNLLLVKNKKSSFDLYMNVS